MDAMQSIQHICKVCHKKNNPALFRRRVILMGILLNGYTNNNTVSKFVNLKGKIKMNTYNFAFNDRTYSDGWVEPYRVEIATDNEKHQIIEEIRNAIDTISKSNKNFDIAIGGIEQILDDIPGIAYTIVSFDEVFAFGNSINRYYL